MTPGFLTARKSAHASHTSHTSHGRNGRNGKNAFTFVEILASMVFLAILVPAVMEGIALASRMSVISERSSVAAELAENKMGELTMDNAWASGETNGDFGNDWPGYRWEATQSTWDMDAMIALNLDVFFTVQGQERSVRLITLVSGSGTQMGAGSL